MVEGKPLPTIYMGCSGRPLGANRTGDTGVGPAPIEGAQTGGPAEDAGRDYLSAAKRLPVEPPAQGVGGRQHHPSDLPALGRVWGAGGHLGGPDRRMPGVGRCGLGMAVGGLLHRQSAFWGGAIGRNPTDRGKAGSKKSILVDAAGGPLSVAVAGANVHDTKLLRPTLESMVVARPPGAQNLCLDKGYDNPTGHGTVAAYQYCAHIRRIGEEKLDQWGQKTCPARRWVVERTLGWLSKCRAILVRYDKKPANYLGLLQLACALIWYRRQRRLAVLR